MQVNLNYNYEFFILRILNRKCAKIYCLQTNLKRNTTFCKEKLRNA